MAGASSVYVNSPYTNGVSFTNSDGTTGKVVAYGNSGLAVLRALLFSNLSASAYTFDIVLRKSSIDYQLARIEVAANAGHADGTPPLNVIDDAVIPGLGSEPDTKLILEASDQVVVKAVSALTSGHQVDVVVLAGRAL